MTDTGSLTGRYCTNDCWFYTEYNINISINIICDDYLLIEDFPTNDKAIIPYHFVLKFLPFIRIVPDERGTMYPTVSQCVRIVLETGTMYPKALIRTVSDQC